MINPTIVRFERLRLSEKTQAPFDSLVVKKVSQGWYVGPLNHETEQMLIQSPLYTSFNEALRAFDYRIRRYNNLINHLMQAGLNSSVDLCALALPVIDNDFKTLQPNLKVRLKSSAVKILASQGGAFLEPGEIGKVISPMAPYLKAVNQIPITHTIISFRHNLTAQVDTRLLEVLDD